VAEDLSNQDSEPGLKKGVLGFLVAQHLAPEWELENIVVAPAARRKGVGKRLIEWLLEEARGAQSESVFLEVRESNTIARALYETTGFQQVGRRKSYYSAPSEDAILYRWNLRPISSG
jgi:ribosomal-protein-alanine N-acetyltransferase